MKLLQTLSTKLKTVFLSLPRRLFFYSVGLFVCLPVSSFAQKGMNVLRQNFMEGAGVVQGTSD